MPGSGRAKEAAVPASWRHLLVTIALVSGAGGAAAGDFHHGHRDWSDLLERHVEWTADGSNSRVDYGGFKADLPALQSYLDRLAAVDMPTYLRWSQAERNAFLINAYNAWTILLIVERYPGIDSIRDIGSLFSTPWAQRFVELLGATRTLDEVEHELLRGAPDFDEPRIHFAVNCASIGCPALRPEAYRPGDLDRQLDDQARRFLGDRSRNSFKAGRRELSVSPIFRWYRDDFHGGHAGLSPPRGFLADYADVLASTPADAARIRAGDYRLRYTRYNWSLNGNR
jgi:hypothetical protein